MIDDKLPVALRNCDITYGEVALLIHKAKMMNDAELIPPFPGTWRKREDLANGLDAAGSLENIAYYLDRQWHTGITSDKVQYWVRMDTERAK